MVLSLLEQAMTACVRLVAEGGGSDGMGGAVTDWREGGRFMATFARVESKPTRRGERDEVSDRYDVTVGRDTALGFHDVFRRISDGAVFRVADSGVDHQTPASSGLALKQVRAERWALPS